MLRKYLLSGSLIAVLCLSGCSNGSELPGYNAKIHYSSSSMYKNDLMDKILNKKSIRLQRIQKLVTQLRYYFVLKI